MNNNNKQQNNMPGEVFSWIIVLIMLAAIWPVGVVLLLKKLKEYAKKQPGVKLDRTKHAERVEIKSDVRVEKAKNKKEGKERSAFDKKTGKLIPTLLLLAAIALFITGGSAVIDAAQSLIETGAGSIFDFLMGGFYLTGGAITLIVRNFSLRKISRFKTLNALIGTRLVIPISDVADATGLDRKTIYRDIRTMIDEGYLGGEAYLDSGLDSLVLSSEAAAKYRRENSEKAASAEQKNPENPYMATILELRALNETILDIPISDKIDRIETVTGKIFRIVEEEPAKLPQINRFMNYYLPTTLKLLNSYAVMEKQDIGGENISAAKSNINRILEKLATGFEQQLDMLFRDDAIDISADISVLENMMRRDGLSGGDEFKTMESGM